MIQCKKCKVKLGKETTCEDFLKEKCLYESMDITEHKGFIKTVLHRKNEVVK